MKRVVVALALLGGCAMDDGGPLSGPDVVLPPDPSVFSQIAPGASVGDAWHDVMVTHIDLGDCSYHGQVVVKPSSRSWFLTRPFVGDRCEVWLGGDFSLGDNTFPTFGQPATYCVFDRHGSLEVHTALPVATVMDEEAQPFCVAIPVKFFPPDCPNCGGGGPL